MTSTEKANWPHEVAGHISYDFDIENFSKKHGNKRVGERVVPNRVKYYMTDHDQIAEFESLRWQVEVYPNGHDERNEGNVTIFLRSLNDFDVTIGCEMFAITYKISNHSLDENNRWESGKFQHAFGSNESLWIKSLVLNRIEVLEAVEKIFDSLAIGIHIFFFEKPQVKYSQLNLLKNVGSLLETGEHFDVTLVSSDGSEHKAHKLILMCRSEVFSRMFRNNLTGSQTNVIDIEDMDERTLKQMLQFMYTGAIESMEDNAEKLFRAADKYLLDDLKEMCDNQLRKNINFDDARELVKVDSIDEPMISYWDEMGDGHYHLVRYLNLTVVEN